MALTGSRAAFHPDVDQVGRCREVVVPQAVVHGLEVPDALAGARIEADDALREQVVARPVPAVVVVRRCRQRYVYVAELLVRARPGPHVRVSRCIPTTDGPGLIAVSHVSLPNSPSWGTVRKIHNCSPVRTSKPRTSPGGARLRAGMARADDIHDCRADHDDVVDDNRRRSPAERIDVAVEALPEVDLATLAEVGEAHAGAGVERHEIFADDGQHARLVAPAGRPSTRRRGSGARAGTARRRGPAARRTRAPRPSWRRAPPPCRGRC